MLTLGSYKNFITINGNINDTLYSNFIISYDELKEIFINYPEVSRILLKISYKNDQLYKINSGMKVEMIEEEFSELCFCQELADKLMGGRDV